MDYIVVLVSKVKNQRRHNGIKNEKNISINFSWSVWFKGQPTTGKLCGKKSKEIWIRYYFPFCANLKNVFNFNIALNVGLELIEHKAKVQNVQASFWIAHLRIFLPVSVEYLAIFSRKVWRLFLKSFQDKRLREVWGLEFSVF